MRELTSAWWSVLRHPWRSLADVDRVAAFERPIWLYAICTTASAVAEHAYYDDNRTTGVVSGLLMGAVRAVPALYVQAGVLHLVLRLFGGTASFAVTLRACALASAPVLLALVPWVGLLGELWSLVLLVFALSRVHSLSVPRAAASLAAPVVLFVSTAFGLRAFVVEAFKIPAASMSPTLLVGDHLFVEKYAYRGGTLPARGDVLVFEYPYAGQAPPQDFVKRVVGLPGDELVFKDGFLSIDGKPVPTCLVGRTRLPSEDGEFDIYLEHLGERSHLVALQRGVPEQIDGPYVVPDGEVWVAGDNRRNSADSRSWSSDGGTTRGAGVPTSRIKGRASRLWMPPARFWTPVNGEPVLPRELSALAPGLSACKMNPR